MGSSERMERIILGAIEAGFTVGQHPSGTWRFRRGGMTITFRRTPETPAEWLDMVNSLSALGVQIRRAADEG